MNKSPRFFSVAWFAIPLCALGFLIWSNAVRIRHVEDVTTQGGWSEKQAAVLVAAASSTSEFQAGNGLIIPGHLTESYHWIAQTQRMFKHGEWRVRHIDYENAPFGRAVNSSSLYRWWLGAVAWCDHLISDRSPAQSVELAALAADPILHFLLLLGTAILVAWRFGALPAALISIGLVTLFPFATGYLPGAPDDRSLAQIFAIGSVLLLVAGVGRATPAPDDNRKSTQRWFIFAGVSGGLALWASVYLQVPILLGVAAGALLAAWVTRNHRLGEAAANADLPWRSWAAAGAVTTLGAYLIEFAPSHLGNWQLSSIHPLYGLAWLGGGEILSLATEWIQNKKTPKTFRNFAVLALALSAIIAVPVAIWKIQGSDFLTLDSSSFRLTKLPEGAIAQSLATWILRDGPSAAMFATFLPLLLIAPAMWFLFRKQTDRERRVSVAITFGPVLVALGFACQQLVWWNALDGLLLVLLVTVTTGLAVSGGWSYRPLAWAAVVLLLLLPGIVQVIPWHRDQTENDLTRSEVLGLIERDLAGWLSLHADPAGAVLLAPPNATTALCYYGRMRGMGAVSRENKEGVAAAVLILKNQNLQEAKAMIDRRKITHLILLSWDASFDEYTRTGTGENPISLRDQLQLARLPLWLRPLAYPMPVIPGFDGQSVSIFEVVDEQEQATGVSRIAEYLVEIGDLDQAAAAAQGLQRYPADFGAWVARAEVELARGDEAGFAKSLKALQARLAVKAPLALPWDQRVGLAVVLAKAKQEKLAREQATACLAAADEGKLRSLSPGSLYRLLVLSRGFGIRMDPKLNEFALTLVSPELRDRLK